jgi:hypothetical protein
MPWVRFDDQLHAHPKVVALGEFKLAAMGLQLMACCWSNAYLTDGFIPANVAEQLAGGDPTYLVVVRALMEARLWEKDTHSDGFVIHDFLDYNPSRREVLTHRKKMQRLGRAAGIASGKSRRSKAEDANRSGSHSVQHFRTPVPSRLASSSSKKKLVSDTEFLAELKAEPGYQGIDLDRELSKCRVWTRSRGRQATRRTFIAWLNRIERPLAEAAGVPEGEEI